MSGFAAGTIRPLSSPPPWFQPAVPFRCLGPECGDCCSGKHGTGAVWVNEEEIAELARLKGLSAEEFKARFTRSLGNGVSLVEKPNFDCVFYEPGKGCTVYPARPSQCRTYPFWSKVMAAKWKWDSEALDCPGIGVDGAHVPAAEIETALAADAQRFPAGRPKR